MCVQGGAAGGGRAGGAEARGAVFLVVPPGVAPGDELLVLHSLGALITLRAPPDARPGDKCDLELVAVAAAPEWTAGLARILGGLTGAGPSTGAPPTRVRARASWCVCFRIWRGLGLRLGRAT